MLDIWGLVLIMDALNLHTDGNNLAVSSSYCRTLSAQHQKIAALQPFPQIDHRRKDPLGVFWEAERPRAVVSGPSVFAQEKQLQQKLLWDTATA